MRNIICFSVTAFILALSIRAAAQPAAFTVLYTNSLEGVTFSREGGNEQRIFAGVRLPLDGQLRLVDGTQARLLYENKKINLEGPGLYAMTDLKRKAEQEVSSGFLTRFWSFISNSIKDTDNAEQVEKYHRRYLTNARAGINGFAERNFAIGAPTYLSQALDHPDVVFRWDSTAHPQGYHFTITPRNGQEPVFTAVAREEQLSVRLDELLLDSSQVYVWKVTALQKDSTMLESNTYPFIYQPDMDAYLTGLKESHAYRQLAEEEQELYLLYQLEEDGYLHYAYRRYQELSTQDKPESGLYKKLFATFLARMDALEEAKSLVK